MTTLAQSLAAHYIDAGLALNDGIVRLNDETVYSAHVELSPGDVIEVELEYLPTGSCRWTHLAI